MLLNKQIVPVLSDLHLGDERDSPEQRGIKRRSQRNIADWMQSHRENIRGIVVNGDWFNASKWYAKGHACTESAEFADALRDLDVPVRYVRGNADNSTFLPTKEVRKLLADTKHQIRLQFSPSLTHLEPGALLTHGHIFDPATSTLVRKVAGLPIRSQAHAKAKNLVRALVDPESYEQDLVSHNAKEGHRTQAKIFSAVKTAVPQRGVDALLSRVDGVFRETFLQAAAERNESVLVMGHTHFPSLTQGAGKVLLNTGTAGAVLRPNATFGNLTFEDGALSEVSLHQSWHPDDKNSVTELAAVGVLGRDAFG